MGIIRFQLSGLELGKIVQCELYLISYVRSARFRLILLSNIAILDVVYTLFLYQYTSTIRPGSCSTKLYITCYEMAHRIRSIKILLSFV